MKKQLLLIILALIFSLKGCMTPPHGGDVPDPPSEDTTDRTCSGADHQDEENDGYCDLCGDYVVVLLDFYTLNDLHGKLADGQNHLGVDEMTTYLKRAVAADDEAFLLSAGDMWQGSAESNNTDGLIITDWMNHMDFAAMTLGNHEYDWGEDAIETNAAQAEFPFLAINIYERDSNEPVDYCQPSVLVDRGDVQVGIIGAMGDCYSSIAGDKTEDIYFVNGSRLTALVKEESARLRAQGADYIVYVIHDGYGNSYPYGIKDVSGATLASYYDVSLSDGWVDLVFEGHTHQRYILKDSYGVYHLQAGGDNKGLSHVEVAVNVANGESGVRTAEFVQADAYRDLADDPVVQELLDKYADEISHANRIVGTNTRLRRSNELKNLVAKLYYEAGLSEWGNTYDITLGGGFISARSPYDLQSGQVTYGTLQSIFPFDNDLVLCSIRGSDLLSRFIHTSNNNYFVYMGEDQSSVIASIDPQATYYIVTDTYCSSYAPNRLTVVETYTPGVYARDLLADYIAQGGMNE